VVEGPEVIGHREPVIPGRTGLGPGGSGIFGALDPEVTGMSGIDAGGVPVASGGSGATEPIRTPKKRRKAKAKDPEEDELGDGLGDIGTAEPNPRRTALKDFKASTVIMGVCAQQVLQYIAHLDTAKEQWDTLKTLYAPSTQLQLGSKLREFIGYQATEGTTVTEMVTALTTLQMEIGAIDPNERPTDSTKIGVLFQTMRQLNAKYGPLLLQLELSGANRQWVAVVAHVTEFERQIGGSKPKATALKATTGNATGSATENDPKFRGKCFYCKKKIRAQAA
jgi:hypothetical protein